MMVILPDASFGYFKNLGLIDECGVDLRERGRGDDGLIPGVDEKPDEPVLTKGIQLAEDVIEKENRPVVLDARDIIA
jgi:hypothetical protein